MEVNIDEYPVIFRQVDNVLFALEAVTVKTPNKPCEFCGNKSPDNHYEKVIKIFKKAADGGFVSMSPYWEVIASSHLQDKMGKTRCLKCIFKARGIDLEQLKPIDPLRV